MVTRCNTIAPKGIQKQRRDIASKILYILCAFLMTLYLQWKERCLNFYQKMTFVAQTSFLDSVVRPRATKPFLFAQRQASRLLQARMESRPIPYASTSFYSVRTGQERQTKVQSRYGQMVQLVSRASARIYDNQINATNRTGLSVWQQRRIGEI